MANIKINSNAVDVMATSIKTSGGKLNADIKNINEPTKCSGIMIKDYYERIKRISTILGKYKQLINKDVSDIKSAKDKMIQMDSSMQKLY